MHGVIRTVKQGWGRSTGWIGAGLLQVAAVLLLLATPCFGAEPSNQLVAVQVDKEAPAPTILIRTAEPVGYRYTVYDSYDPVRVVVDFPGMDMADVAESLPVDKGVVEGVRVANFDLSSGKLARVEVLLQDSADYQVQIDETEFRLIFSGPVMAATADKGTPEAAAKVVEATIMAETNGASGETGKALTEVSLAPGRAVLSADSELGQYKYFTLNKPPRLVVDLFGVQPAFEQRKFPAEGGISLVRVGTYQGKTRFVFDAEGSELPDHSVDRERSDLIVTWNQADAGVAEPEMAEAGEPAEASVAEMSREKEQPVESQAAVPAAKPVKAENSEPVTVEAVEFENENGRSYLVVSLSDAADVTGPNREGNLIRFGIKNATISRALRRTLDTFAFPTAIASVTPYTVAEQNRHDVRFAVELKGEAAHALEQDGPVVRLAVDDGAFAEAEPPDVDVVEVEAPAVDKAAVPDPGPEPELGVIDEDALTLPAEQMRYTGQKISLVFDSADIRSILQLIGDVSDLNILASDDVEGTITLRLIDVPWDQALELILETADLGKIRQGNVLRIMPKERIREMAQAELQSQKQEIEEAPLESRVFRISYSSVDDMKTVITDLLTERGNIIADPRNKQLIVKDVPPVLDEMATLISQIDQPEKQVMIEARIVEANTNFSRDLGVKWGLGFDNDADSTPGSGVGSTSLASSNLGLGGAFLITPPATGSVGSAGAALGFSFGTVGVDTLTMDLRLSALESAGKGKIVSTPRVTTLNGEAATISQGTKIPYTTVSETGTETSFENAELKLEVTPEINPDGSVILEINASNSAVGTIVPTGTGNAVSIDEKKAETKVLVRDGETTVIGGIFVEDERDADSGVPLLKDLPLLGHLFKSTTKTRDRRELLIFITPRILE